ncbi:hypothetical protein ACW7G0_08380 [Lysobacter sp. A286]
MKHMLIGAVLVVIAPPALADDLYCQGRTYMSGKQVETTRVLSIDFATLRASVSTSEGRAFGVLDAKPEIYLGQLSTAKGKDYWINLNRYTGELIVFPMPMTDGGFADYSGTCTRAEPAF